MTETPHEPTHPYRRRMVALSAVALSSAAIAAGFAGAVIGHAVWPGRGSTVSADHGNFGLGGELPDGGTTPAASGAPANTASIAAKVDPALVDIDVSLGYQSAGGAGTGIVVSSDGEVLTNNHVIAGATKITAVDVGNGKTYTAKVVGYDPSHDLAVLQLQGASGLRTATFGDSSKVAVGDGVVGIGNAGGTGGTPSTAGGSVTGTAAQVTAADELSGASETLTGLIETNAPIQPGDSGGPLVNANGEIVGIDTAGSSAYSFGSSTTDAYAIPIDTALDVAKQIEAGNGSSTVHVGDTAFLGISVADGFGASSGLGVANVLSGNPAEKAGIVAGDTITSVDGRSVDSQTSIAGILLRHHPGDTVSIGWTDASGQSHTASVTLASGPQA